jgi:RNA polymerase sigma-70 factor (ECF subfamily)
MSAIADDAARARDVLQRAVDGDRFALGELWDTHNAALVRFLRSLRVREPDDVAAEVWVDLARRMPSIDADPETFRKLLFTIGRRRAIDAHRLRSRRPSFDVDPRSHLRFVDPAKATDEVVGDELVAQALLARLPRAQAEVVALRVIAGFSAAEVAELTDRSEGAVRIMAMRGLRRLRDLAVEAGLGTSDEVPTSFEVTDDDESTMVQP